MQDAEVGTLLMENLKSEELYEIGEKIIDVYSKIGKKRETFHKYLKRIGKNQLLNSTSF